MKGCRNLECRNTHAPPIACALPGERCCRRCCPCAFQLCPVLLQPEDILLLLADALWPLGGGGGGELGGAVNKVRQAIHCKGTRCKDVRTPATSGVLVHLLAGGLGGGLGWTGHLQAVHELMSSPYTSERLVHSLTSSLILCASPCCIANPACLVAQQSRPQLMPPFTCPEIPGNHCCSWCRT